MNFFYRFGSLKSLNKLLPTKYFILFYPLLILIVAGVFLIPYTKPYLKEVISFGLFSSILFCIHFLTRSYINNILYTFFLILLSILIFIKLSFYSLYNVKLSASALFVIFETNSEEASDFMNSYIDYTVVILFFIIFIPAVFYLLKPLFKSNSTRLNSAQKSYSSSKLTTFSLLLWIFMATLTLYKKFPEFNILYTSAISYSEYQQTKALLKTTLAKPKSDNIEVITSLDIPQTYIVIIGESTSNWHMQLYGYQRKTNPLLTEINKELLLFKDVISPNVHTILALDKILTLSDYENPMKEENSSVVQLANQAGFTTYWVSNQRPVGFHESVSTLLGSAANQKYFLATDDYTSNIYDEKIVPKLKNILNQKVSKKMIFIHLIGTHSDYKKRYPEKFKYFAGTSAQTKFGNAESEDIVNQYDNAVRYNDYVVRNIIEAAREENKVGYVLYFSDHGDEVFDTMELMGHNEYYGTKPMYEVPLIVWLSEKYKIRRPSYSSFKENENMKYNLEDFIYSFSDLSFINFNLSDSSRSIFSADYKERIRWIKKGEDYDKK